MALWRYSVGNLVSRAVVAPAAVSPALEDALLPLVNLGSGYPDAMGGFQWRSDGAYAVDFDLNLLADDSENAAAPTGWFDLLLVLAGSPGLSANPADWGSYGSRSPALRIFRPHVQFIDVMPGEDVQLAMGIYWPTAASGATGIRVRVVDGWSGKGWNGTAWASGGVLESQTVGDTWKDFAETITADPNRTERSTYSVIIEPIASSFGATTYCYVSANGAAGTPALYGAVDLCAIVGHNLPADATVALAPQPSGTTLTLTSGQPSMFVAGVSEQLVQTWRLSIQMPSGIQPRPLLGEVWIGSVRALDRSPSMDGLGYQEGDADQIRIPTARGRVEVLASEGRPTSKMGLQFRVSDDDYVRIRDEQLRLTRFGQEPMLLIPSSAFEGGRFYHGRVGEEVGYSRMTAADSTEAWRSFTLAFSESPMPLL